MAAYLGLEHSATGQVGEKHMAASPSPVIWLHFQECTCCSESFIRSSSHPHRGGYVARPDILDYTVKHWWLHPGSQGRRSHDEYHDEICRYKYILCVKEAVPTAADGVYCMIGGKHPCRYWRLPEQSHHCLGQLPCNGCVQAAKPKSYFSNTDT